MCSIAALCMARWSAILNSGLSGLSWTASVKNFTARSQSPLRAASSPRRNARPPAQAEATAATSRMIARLRRLKRVPRLLCHAFLSGHPERRPSAAVLVFNHEGLDADLHDPVPAVDKFPFETLDGMAA